MYKINKIIKIFLITVVFCVLPLINYSAQQQLMPRDDVPGLTNFAKVSDTLYRGAQPMAQGFAELKRMDIKTIINLRDNHSDVKMLKGLGLQYVSIPIKSWHIEDKEVVEFLKVVTNPQNQPVFVHCQHGSDRTGTLVAIYRMYVQGWARGDAIKELSNFGFHKIYINLKKYLKNLDLEKLKQQLKTAPELKIDFMKLRSDEHRSGI